MQAVSFQVVVIFLSRVMMEKVLASESDIIHMKLLSVNNMLRLPLMLYNLDTDNIPLIINLLNIAMFGKFFKLESLNSHDI